MAKTRLTCNKCNAFFGYEEITGGVVELYCTKCKSWTILKAVQKEIEDKEDNG